MVVMAVMVGPTQAETAVPVALALEEMWGRISVWPLEVKVATAVVAESAAAAAVPETPAEPALAEM